MYLTERWYYSILIIGAFILLGGAMIFNHYAHESDNESKVVNENDSTNENDGYTIVVEEDGQTTTYKNIDKYIETSDGHRIIFFDGDEEITSEHYIISEKRGGSTS